MKCNLIFFQGLVYWWEGFTTNLHGVRSVIRLAAIILQISTARKLVMDFSHLYEKNITLKFWNVKSKACLFGLGAGNANLVKKNQLQYAMWMSAACLFSASDSFLTLQSFATQHSLKVSLTIWNSLWHYSAFKSLRGYSPSNACEKYAYTEGQTE